MRRIFFNLLMLLSSDLYRNRTAKKGYQARLRAKNPYRKTLYKHNLSILDDDTSVRWREFLAYR